MTELDALDRALLERLQSDFPLTLRPFAALGQALDLSENEVLTRVRRLKEKGIIRQIGAIFDSRRLGYQSALAAFHVPEEALEEIAQVVSSNPGVSHNYARPHHYNLWFTLAVPPGQESKVEIGQLAQVTGVEDWLYLPADRVFKIRTHFRLQGTADPGVRERSHSTQQVRRDLTPEDIPYVRMLQEDLALVASPFVETARSRGTSGEGLLERARELQAAGLMRRFGAVLRHRRAGYTANGMACWVVPADRIQEAGLLAAEFPQVSHCYQRPAYPPRWPYNLFTMIHGRTRDEVEAVVAEIAEETGIGDCQVLYSTREFKKERVRYFEEAR
jgi:DNA-binding Lrp family transcriptional regulator